MMCQHISPKIAIDILGKQAEQTGRSLCSAWRSNLYVGASIALLCVQIRSDPPRRAGERRKQPADQR